ncbi:MAG: hypothetical protein WCO00_08850 [Rhodospirillaceae bacterium]
MTDTPTKSIPLVERWKMEGDDPCPIQVLPGDPEDEEGEVFDLTPEDGWSEESLPKKPDSPPAAE